MTGVALVVQATEGDPGLGHCLRRQLHVGPAEGEHGPVVKRIHVHIEQARPRRDRDNPGALGTSALAHMDDALDGRDLSSPRIWLAALSRST